MKKYLKKIKLNCALFSLSLLSAVENWPLIVGLSVGVGVPVVAAVALIIYCVMKHKRQPEQHNYELAAVGDSVQN